MKKKSCLTHLAVALLAWGSSFAADDAPLRVKAPTGSLTIDGNGIGLAPSVAPCPAISPKGDPLWAVLLQPEGGPPLKGEPMALTDKGQAVRKQAEADGVRLIYDQLTDGRQTWKIALTLDIRRKGDAFEITGQLRNDAQGWVVCGFVGPVLGGIAADLATHPVLMADGFGKRINQTPPTTGKPAPWSPSAHGFEITSHYPGRSGTMQWCAFAGEKGGLYIGSHDAAHGGKLFDLRYSPATGRFGIAIKHEIFRAAGQSWTMPPMLILPYQGTWHTAARYYRSWFDSTTSLCDVPGWARDASGWLLCILKQQNGEVLWDYPSLEKLCDVADQRGLDILGLFGWAHGGHDHLYPDYLPDPKMGGEGALRKALKELRRRGKRSIIYANGQLQERDTEFWNTQGKDLAVIQRDGVSVQQTYHKYNNIPIYRFDLGCLATRAWYDRMLSLAIQANDFGADGILFDQLGMSGPMACYGSGHGHPVPAMVYGSERPAFIRRIADHMKQVNPEFIVMTEGLHDSVLDSIAMFHGCVLGMFYASSEEIASRLRRDRATDAFPEMFRYTFPEVMSTVRVPTPMMDRQMANYTCTYGLRYEIESRYAPDVRYLRENQVPDTGEYEHVINKPDVGMMKATPPGEAIRYLKTIIEFQRAHAGLLWRGRFSDTQGFSFKGDGLIAKGFAAGDSIAVIVWNPGSSLRPFALGVPGAELMSASEPERGKVEPFGALPPQSLRLFVWKRRASIQ